MDMKKIKKLFLGRLKKKKSTKKKENDLRNDNFEISEDLSCSDSVLNKRKNVPSEEISSHKKLKKADVNDARSIILTKEKKDEEKFNSEFISTENKNDCDDNNDVRSCTDDYFENTFDSISAASDSDYSSFESSSEEEEDENGTNDADAVEAEKSIQEKLRQWVTDSGVVHGHVDNLLKILKTVIPDLPVTTKTFLKEFGEFEFIIENIQSPTDLAAPAEFVYFGLADYLKKIINTKNHKLFKLLLQFFIDGLPLFRSSNIQFWPLLAKIKDSEILYEPFIVACYCGESKPFSPAQYFEKFITELNFLLANGILIDEQKFEIAVDCFICDRPARAFAKQIIGHQGFWACERCVVEGLTFERRRIYPSIHDELRTDESFRKFENLYHHIGFSPDCKINPKISMVKHFPLDVLHLAFLGILKKLMNEKWLNGHLKLSKELIDMLNRRLLHLASQIPSDFQRSTRSLQLINLWKGTEYRMFCLYFGFLITLDILPTEWHRNFTEFSIALRILHDPRLIKSHLQKARDLLKSFVTKFGELYGLESLVLNLHSLVHLPDDVEFHQCSLSDLSAFLFESYLKKVKKNIRHGKKPLHQLCKRVAEKKRLLQKVSKSKAKYIVKETKTGKIKEVKSTFFSVKPKEPNNVVQLTDNSFFKINKIFKREKNLLLEGSHVKLVNVAGEFPSRQIFQDLNIYEIDPSFSAVTTELSIKQIARKAVIFHILEAKSYIMPLLH